MLLQFRALGVTMSWDDGFLGARASRPHKAWHSLGHLPHLDQPGMAPCFSFGLANAVPADRVAACSIARKLSGGQRDRMRAGRPRSQGMPSRRWFPLKQIHLASCPSWPFVVLRAPLWIESRRFLPLARIALKSRVWRGSLSRSRGVDLGDSCRPRPALEEGLDYFRDLVREVCFQV